MTAKKNRQWRLAARSAGLMKDSDFRWVSEPVGSPADGEILVRNVYLSLDPASRHFCQSGRRCAGSRSLYSYHLPSIVEGVSNRLLLCHPQPPVVRRPSDTFLRFCSRTSTARILS